MIKTIKEKMFVIKYIKVEIKYFIFEDINIFGLYFIVQRIVYTEKKISLDSQNSYLFEFNSRYKSFCICIETDLCENSYDQFLICPCVNLIYCRYVILTTLSSQSSFPNVEIVFKC